ncbi:MAG: ATP-binding cassette domain-containing protein, partial [Caulobacteraceae bacterium]
MSATAARATAAAETSGDASTLPQPAGLVVDRIGKAFRGRPVVKGVSLHLARGEVAGLLGPNGAGKTTCFYMITGLIAADYGTIFLDDEDITNQPMYQRARLGLGYLPQETSIFRGMTVEQNIMAVVEMREPNRDKVRASTTELLEELH